MISVLAPEQDVQSTWGIEIRFAECFRKAALLLSAQPDQQAVTKALAEVAGTLPFVGHASVYQVRSTGREPDAALDQWRLYSISDCESASVTAVVGAVACLQQGRPVELVLGNGSTRLVQPVPGHPRDGLLVLDGFEASLQARRLLADLVGLVGNLNRLHALSERDGLTGLYNRQVFDQRLSKLQNDLEHACRRRSDPNLTCYLALLDLDHFKRINDNHGHLRGDAVLVSMARLMERNFRYTDELFRYGGEEFAVILRQVHEDEARIVLERLRQQVSASLFPALGTITISIGYCKLEPGSPQLMIERADRALYFCKHQGRDRVVGYPESEAETALGVE